MSNAALLANRLREVYLDGRWIANTHFKEQVLSTTWKEAVHKIQELNTIAALVFHVNYYLAGLLSAFETGKLTISDKDSYKLPPITSEADWAALVAAFLSNAQAFADKVGQMEDRLLTQPFIDPKYGTYLRNIEGVIEHSYYHLGQITLIRKLIPRDLNG